MCLVSLKVADEQNILDFHPEFTYPIFGQEERIFGYKDLVIKVGNNECQSCLVSKTIL